ncbi:MAG: DUF2867 domain-containing protein [Acidobacteriota bacterium]
MKTITKTAIAGGTGLLAAYFLLIRPQQSKCKAALLKSEEVQEKFNRLPLKAHHFLAGIPMHSLDYLQLKGGREKLTIAEIYNATGLSDMSNVELGFGTKALFGLRTLIGKVMHWDEVPELVETNSYLSRLGEAERAKSLIPPGEIRGISRVLYCYENEMLLEIINQTVHCFWLLASEPTADGYGLYNAVYVKHLNWRTPIYMTLISPILKEVIYPAIDKSMQQNWERYS